MGRKADLSDFKLPAVPSDDRTPFNDAERLVIELADAMTDTPTNVSDDLYASLRNQFSKEQLMQLGAQNRVRELSRTLEPKFSTSRAKIYTRRSQTNRNNHDQPECVDVSPAPRPISSGQFCNSAIVRRVPVISPTRLR